MEILGRLVFVAALPLLGLGYLMAELLWSWISSWNGPLCCRHCREIIPDPGEPGQCRSCGYYYDDAGRIIGDPGMHAKMSNVDLDRFEPTDRAANEERIRREGEYRETADD